MRFSSDLISAKERDPDSKDAMLISSMTEGQCYALPCPHFFLAISHHPRCSLEAALKKEE